MPSHSDPRAQAITKFASSATWAGQLDILARCATDAPLAVDTLVTAVREAAPRGARVCELGFGPAWLLDEMRQGLPGVALYGLDLSAAAVRDARARFAPDVALLRGDMERLPFRDAAFDAVVTCWTLYFMRDIGAALAEIRRCIGPGGRLVAATTAPDHMHEFDELAAESMRAALGRDPEPDTAIRFNTETGAEHMRRSFRHVELREWRGELALPDAESAQILLPNYGPQLRDPTEAAAVRDEFARRAASRIAPGRPWRITRHDGAFIATP